MKAIPYLDAGHYLGIEKEQGLLNAGVTHEIGRELYEAKRPVLIANAAFEFDRFGQQPDFAIAQSLFTHLTPDMIDLCLGNLRTAINPSGVLYATFNTPVGKNPARSHDHDFFGYTAQQMTDFGERNGFAANYIGDWGHPRGQLMMEYHCPNR